MRKLHITQERFARPFTDLDFSCFGQLSFISLCSCGREAERGLRPLSDGPGILTRGLSIFTSDFGLACYLCPFFSVDGFQDQLSGLGHSLNLIRQALWSSTTKLLT